MIMEKIDRDFALDPGLLLYLPLHKLDGASFKSEDAYGRLCTVNGATWIPQGRSLQTDDLLSVPNNPSLSFGNGTNDTPFTMAAWVYMRDATSFGIFSKGDTSKYEYLFRAGNATDLPQILLYGAGDAAKYLGRQGAAQTAYENQWVLYFATYTGSGTAAGLALYRNLTRIDTTDADSGLYVAMNNYDQPLQIGSYWTTQAAWANGIFGDMFMFNRVLSLPEMTRLMQATQWRYR